MCILYHYNIIYNNRYTSLLPVPLAMLLLARISSTTLMRTPDG